MSRKVEKNESGDAALKPCPFCGSTPDIDHEIVGTPAKTVVICTNDKCPAQPCVIGLSDKHAAELWNRRHGGGIGPELEAALDGLANRGLITPERAERAKRQIAERGLYHG